MSRHTLLTALLLAAAAAQAGADAPPASPRPQAMLDSAQFARDTGATSGAASSFGRLALPALGADAQVAWGVVSVDGDPQPYLVLRKPCKGKAACPAKTLRLPLGADVAALALLDRRGAPFTLNLLQPPADPAAAQWRASSARPALLLRVRQALPDGASRSTLVLAALDGAAPLGLWREVDTSNTRDGGYRSHQLAFLADKGGWLALELGQTTLPAAGAQPQMPGPPLALRFVYDGQTYQRQR
ncbi:hypothetical protein BurJ1DRAFT_3800 [Burkholderiales bacterium JOSHI_001]|nr:hypothetical protein BurJ1DRAFT_3800 [Burkholderiales bacterium JOSHI_001]